MITLVEMIKRKETIKDIFNVIFSGKYDLNDIEFIKYFNENLLYKVNRMFSIALKKDIDILERFLNFIIKREKEWVDSKIDDGYYVYYLLDDYISKLEDNSIEKKIFLMDYLSKNFSDSFKIDARNNKIDYELLLKERPDIYYQIDGVCKYGSYIQTKDLFKKPIEWDIIDRNGDILTLLSKYALDVMIYGKEPKYGKGDVLYNKSYLREWLNTDFYNIAFNEKEKEGIKSKSFKEMVNEEKEIESFTDNVSLLSNTEFYSLLNDSMKTKSPTEYAKIKLDDVRNPLFNNKCWWWFNNCISHAYQTSFTKNGASESGHVDSRKCDTYSACVVPLIYVDINNLKKNEIEQSIKNKERIDKTKGIPTGMGKIKIDNERIAICSKTKTEKIKKELSKKGACILPIDENTTYIILESSFGINLVNNWELALENEENNKSHLISYDVLKYFMEDIKKIDIEKNEAVIHFVARHYLMNRDAWINDSYSPYIHDYLYNTNKVLNNISHTYDRNFLKCYLLYLIKSEIVWELDSNCLENNFDCLISELLVGNFDFGNHEINDILNDYLRNNADGVFHSVYELMYDLLPDLIIYYRDNNMDFFDVIKNQNQYFMECIFMYYQKHSDPFSKQLKNYFINNLETCFNLFAMYDEDFYYNDPLNKEMFIKWAIKNGLDKKMNFSLMNDKSTSELIEMYEDMNKEIPLCVKRNIIDNTFEILKKGRSDYFFIDWIVVNYDLDEEYTLDKYEDWISKYVSEVLSISRDIENNKFLKAVKNLFIKFKHEILPNISYIDDFTKYIKENDNQSNFNLDSYNDDELYNIFYKYYANYKEFDKEFRDEFEEIIKFKIKDFSIKVLMERYDNIQDLHKYLKYFEKKLIKEKISDGYLCLYILMDALNYVNWYSERMLIGYLESKFTKEEMEKVKNPDMNYLIYQKIIK